MLSPQFLLWLVPAALLVTGRYGRSGRSRRRWAVLLATQLYFPVRYWDLVALETGPIALLVIRDTLLIVLLACAWPRRESLSRNAERGDGRRQAVRAGFDDGSLNQHLAVGGLEPAG